MSRPGSPSVTSATTSVRVIHVAPTPFGLAGLLGGGERYPLELARALAAAGADCELLTFAARGHDTREPGGLRLRTLRCLGYFHDHPAHPLSPWLLPALNGADLVHTHQLRSAPSRVAALAARARRHRVVVTDHGLQGGDWGGVLPRLFDRFLVVSAFSARELRAPPARTRIIYGGADPVSFAPDPGARRRGILFVGRMTPHKGLDRLIAALPPGAHLRVAGSAGHDPRPPEGDYPLLLRRLAAGRDVEFLGPVSDEGLASLYRESLVLVLPSVEETCYGKRVRVSELLGLVVLEAMASGTPVVCSRLGGLSEVVEHGVTGYLVEPGNVAELRERLAELLGNHGLVGRLGGNARETVLARFTWERCAQRCLEAYRELV